MRNYKDKLSSLSSDSVWKFPKQDTDFDNAFRAAKLFNDIPNREEVNIESYFEKNYKKYGITTSRHRMFVISQMYGLITKTLFYKKRLQYSNEKNTSVFYLMNSYDIGSYQYNLYKTEQILKIKMKAIIDTTSDCDGWNILPVVYSFNVLKNLKEMHGIDTISLEQFYTYVMTCGDFSSSIESIEFIKANAPVSPHIERYKDLSRFINILCDNINLFIIENQEISINLLYQEYFQTLFINIINLKKINSLLSSEEKYADFLYNPQSFGVNLIDLPEVSEDIKEQILEDVRYTNEVDKVDDQTISESVGINAHRNEPSVSKKTTTKRYSTNPILGKKAILKADYMCENNLSHTTFTSESTGKPFMEAHHLIPVPNQKEFWEKYKVNIDCLENLVSLCPNCHRSIHYACQTEKISLIKRLYKIKKSDFDSIDLAITENELVELYKKKGVGSCRLSLN